MFDMNIYNTVEYIFKSFRYEILRFVFCIYSINLRFYGRNEYKKNDLQTVHLGCKTGYALFFH